MATHVYSELVEFPYDLVGALAYSLYKQTKVEWVVALQDRNGGVSPTAAEIAMFHDMSVLPAQLKGYRDRASAISSDFLTATTQDRVDQLISETQQSALAVKFDTTHQAVATALLALQRELVSRRRTWKSWCGDVAAALLINALTLLLVAGLYYGYQHLSALTDRAEAILHLAPPAGSPPASGVGPPDQPTAPK